MRFSLASFVRHCDLAVLERYFAARGLFLGADWSEEKAARAAVVLSIEGLAEDRREDVFAELEQAASLKGELGQRALRAVTEDGGLRERLDGRESDEGRALEVLLEAPETFEAAIRTHQAEELRKSSTWSSFRIGAGLTPAPAGDEAKKAIQAVYETSHGARGGLAIEGFARRGVILDESGPPERIEQWSIFAKDNPQTLNVFQDAALDRLVVHPAIAGAVTYDPATGVLDALTPGGRPAQEALAKAFAAHLFGWNAELDRIELRRYRPDRLKRKVHFATDPEDGIEDVAVTRLILAHQLLQGSKLILDHPRDASDTIWQRSHEMFGARDPLAIADWRVVAAELRVIFRKDPKVKGRRVIPIKLQEPNGCSLKNQTERERLIGEKYLERWRLAEPLDG